VDGQLVWFVAFLLYVYDSISFRDRGAVLRYSIGGATAILMEPTLKIGGYRIFVPNPLRPDYSDLLLTSSNSAELSPLDQYFIRRASSIYLVHQMVAVGCLLALFVVTPLLARRMNLLYACSISVGTTFWLCSFHWIQMWKNRRLLGIDGKIIRSDIVHVVLCPPNAVNCARRIAALRRPRYGVKPCLRAFSWVDARKYEEELRAVSSRI
jgi:hypothetical protein